MGQQGWAPEDFWQLQMVSDMRLAPNGRQVAYTVERQDHDANERRAALWLSDLHTGDARQLTSGAKRDFAPRWSPAGTHLAFLSTRAGDEAQVFVLDVAGGEARQLTHMRHSAGEPFWSGDGTWIGFEAEVRADESPFADAPGAEDAAARERRRKEEEERPRLVTRLQYRWDGKGYFEGRTHLFRVILADGHVEALTEGDYDDGDGACSPDGKTLAFLSDRSEQRDANMTNDLWLLDLASRNLRRLTDGHTALSRLAWSPDGKRIAFVAEPEVRDHAVYNQALCVLDLARGAVTNLLAGEDISADVGLYSDLPKPEMSAPQWSADGTSLTLLAQRGGGVDVLRVPVTGGAVERILSGERAHAQQVALPPDGSRLLLLRSTPTQPWDIALYDLPAGGQASALTQVNQALLASRPLADPERFTFASFDGQRLDAWLYRPAEAPASGQASPLVLWVHGGPHAAFGESFFLLVQIFASRGYAVLHVNPRGSSGYGEAFAQACDHDWGGGDYRDVMAAVDAALARGGLDAARLAIMGTSYGGYMTNWAVTQTGRFKAAVTINSVTNLWSSFGTGDIDSVWASGDYGWPWENEQFYRERSPVMHATRVTTPIRIIAAENDYRCPISQSEEWYTWLKKLGHVPVDFVRLPKASHSVFASPRQRIRRMELVLEWIERYCPAR